MYFKFDPHCGHIHFMQVQTDAKKKTDKKNFNKINNVAHKKYKKKENGKNNKKIK